MGRPGGSKPAEQPYNAADVGVIITLILSVLSLSFQKCLIGYNHECHYCSLQLEPTKMPQTLQHEANPREIDILWFRAPKRAMTHFSQYMSVTPQVAVQFIRTPWGLSILVG